VTRTLLTKDLGEIAVNTIEIIRVLPIVGRARSIVRVHHVTRAQAHGVRLLIQVSNQVSSRP
jgi:hypothetical protein